MLEQLGCTTGCYSKFPFERALQGIAEAGLKFVEIGAVPVRCEHVKPELMDKKQLKELRCKLEGYGLKALSISGHCDLTDPKGVELFKKRIDLAFAMGIAIVNTSAGKINTKAAEESFFENMDVLSGYLKERGITAALECHGGIVGTGKECRKTIERIASEHVRINYDPADGIFYEGVNPEEDIMDIVDYIAHVHIKDKLEGKSVWNFPAIGEGYVNFEALFDILDNNNYHGPFSLEIEFLKQGPAAPEEVDTALKKSVAYLSRLKKRSHTFNIFSTPKQRSYSVE